MREEWGDFYYYVKYCVDGVSILRFDNGYGVHVDGRRVTPIAWGSSVRSVSDFIDVASTVVTDDAVVVFREVSGWVAPPF